MAGLLDSPEGNVAKSSKMLKHRSFKNRSNEIKLEQENESRMFVCDVDDLNKRVGNFSFHFR